MPKKTMTIDCQILVDYQNGDPVKEAQRVVNNINNLLQDANWNDSPQISFNLDGKGKVIIEDF